MNTLDAPSRIAVSALSLILMVSFGEGRVWADETAPVFKRVKPPAAGTTQRITIQIEKTWPYETDPPVTSAEPSAAPTEPKLEEAAWFWDRTGLGFDNAGPDRITRALGAMNAASEEVRQITPNSAALEATIKEYGAQTLIASAGKRVSPALVMAVMVVESSGRKGALSNKGAQGLMQLMPATAQRFDVSDPSDPQDNIRGGAAYLDWLLAEFKGDPLLALAGYNAGENAVHKHQGVPPYPETRRYVPKVLAAWDRVRLYCQSLPRYVDDGCVFDLSRSIKQ